MALIDTDERVPGQPPHLPRPRDPSPRAGLDLQEVMVLRGPRLGDPRPRRLRDQAPRRRPGNREPGPGRHRRRDAELVLAPGREALPARTRQHQGPQMLLPRLGLRSRRQVPGRHLREGGVRPRPRQVALQPPLSPGRGPSWADLRHMGLRGSVAERGPRPHDLLLRRAVREVRQRVRGHGLAGADPHPRQLEGRDREPLRRRLPHHDHPRDRTAVRALPQPHRRGPVRRPDRTEVPRTHGAVRQRPHHPGPAPAHRDPPARVPRIPGGALG